MGALSLEASWGLVLLYRGPSLFQGLKMRNGLPLNCLNTLNKAMIGKLAARKGFQNRQFIRHNVNAKTNFEKWRDNFFAIKLNISRR